MTDIPTNRPHLFSGRDPEGRMSFMAHLMELRRRLMVVALALFFTTVVTMIFYQSVVGFLMAPVKQVNRMFAHETDMRWSLMLTRINEDLREDLVRIDPETEVREKVLTYWDDPQRLVALQATGLDPVVITQIQRARPDVETPVVDMSATDMLGTMLMLMKVALWAGVVLSSPVLLYEIWAFVAPGLSDRERRAIRPVLVGGVLCFLTGAALCYYLVFPITLQFLVWFELDLGVKPRYTPKDYMDLLVTFMLIFGALFEIPVVAAVLAKLGLVSPGMLTRYWRFIILFCFICGALFSPGSDPMSMMIMSGTLIFLYLVSLALTVVCYPKKVREHS